MTMKTIVLAFLMMTSLLSAGPQTSAGSIEGTVVRLGTTDPIAGVNIEMRRVEGTAASPLLPPVFASGYFSPGATRTPELAKPCGCFLRHHRQRRRVPIRQPEAGQIPSSCGSS